MLLVPVASGKLLLALAWVFLGDWSTHKACFFLEVCSDFTDLKINMGNDSSEAIKSHDYLPFIDTKLAEPGQCSSMVEHQPMNQGGHCSILGQGTCPGVGLNPQ